MKVFKSVNLPSGLLLFSRSSILVACFRMISSSNSEAHCCSVCRVSGGLAYILAGLHFSEFIMEWHWEATTFFTVKSL